jgi:DNA-binding transcriptional MerR regulator
MPAPAYTTAEVAQITGFSVRQLDYWAQQGLLVPGIQQSRGPGTRRLYGLDDLVQLRFIRQIKRYGWSTHKIRAAITTLRVVMEDPDPLKNAVLVHSKGILLALCKTKEGERILLDALNAGGQQVMGIVLETLEEETRRVAEKFSDEVTSHG